MLANCGGGTGDSPVDFRPDSPVSPEFLELRDITTTQGADAANVRFRQLERNRVRRELRSDRKRYADLALRLNLKKAAERLAEQKVAEKLAEAGIAPRRPRRTFRLRQGRCRGHEEVRRHLRRNRRLPRQQGGQNRLSSSRSELAEVLKGHSFSCAVQVF